MFIYSGFAHYKKRKHLLRSDPFSFAGADEINEKYAIDPSFISFKYKLGAVYAYGGLILTVQRGCSFIWFILK